MSAGAIINNCCCMEEIKKKHDNHGNANACGTGRIDCVANSITMLSDLMLNNPLQNTCMLKLNNSLEWDM